MSEIAKCEADRLMVLGEIEKTNLLLAENPQNQGLLEVKAELDAMLAGIEQDLANAKAAAAEAKKLEKKDHARTNADTRKDEQAAEPSVAIKYAVNDEVMAKWVSGDKAFYAARITSVTGSSSDPVYTVKFKGYDTVETLRGKDIRPVTNPATKRKAELMENVTPSSGTASPATVSPPAIAGSNGVVVQKGPEKYANTPDKAADDKPKPKFKKMKPTKELEANKSNWQNFNAKGKFGKSGGLPKKKESMFRVPEGANGRVGFIGSGQTMRKDVTRTRHVYQVADEDN
ncbi:hypothetical protein V8F20_002391 [Naviculisporaceae sp. PSN 640]